MSPSHHPLTSADTAWLHMDRPTNLMVINGVLLFERPLDWTRVSEIIRLRLVDRFPRFRQRVAESRIMLRGPRWEEDPDFDLSRHLHRRGLPEPGDEAALRALVSDLASMPLDRDRPLWDMYLVDGPAGGSAIVVRVHHCVGDGVALARVLLTLADDSPQPPPSAPEARRDGRLDAVLGPLERSLSAAARVARSVATEGRETLTHPHHALDVAGGLAADARALAKLVLSPGEEKSILRDELGAARAFAWSAPIALARVKALARTHKATVNDVLLAAVSGALRHYLVTHGEEPHEVRAFVPVNLRPAEAPVPVELGNQFGLVLLALPVDRWRRSERLALLKRRMDDIKHSPEGPVSYAVLAAIGMTPSQVEAHLVDVFAAKASAVITNVVGPHETLSVAGVPVRTVLVWAPTAGTVDMSISIFSYRGEVTVGLLVHLDAVPNPELIVEGLEHELGLMEQHEARDAVSHESPERPGV